MEKIIEVQKRNGYYNYHINYLKQQRRQNIFANFAINKTVKKYDGPNRA